MPRVALQTAAAIFAPLVFGQVLVMTSPTFVASDKCPASPDALNCYYSMGSFEGMYASIISIGALLGCSVVPKVLVRAGYRNTLVLINLVFTLGCAVHLVVPAPPSAADNTAVMLVLLAVRLVLGLAIGGSCAVCPSFLTAIAPVEKRGAFGSLFQISIVFGIFLECLLGMFLTWKPLMLVAVASSLVGVVMSYFFIPRSAANTDGTAQDDTGTPPDAQQAVSAAEQSSLVEVLRNPASRKPFLISTAVLVGQQASGINALMFFMGTIFQEIFGDQETANTVVAGVQLCQLITTLFSPLMVEKLGRRTILLYGFAALGACMAIMGAAMIFDLPGPVAVAAVFLYVAVFSCGVGGIPWFLVDEMNSAANVATAKTIGQTLNWALGFIIVLTVEPLQSVLTTGGVFLLYAANLVVCTVVVYKFVPETKGKTIAEISAEINTPHLGDRKPSIIFEDPDTEMQNGDLFVLQDGKIKKVTSKTDLLAEFAAEETLLGMRKRTTEQTMSRPLSSSQLYDPADTDSSPPLPALDFDLAEPVPAMVGHTNSTTSGPPHMAASAPPQTSEPTAPGPPQGTISQVGSESDKKL